MNLRTLLVLVLAAFGCNSPAGSFPPPPGPPTMPAPPLVVGHWLLETSTSGEYLRVETDGTFVEAGGSPFDVGTAGTISEGETWAGSWTFIVPDQFSLDDERTGEHKYSVFLYQSDLVLSAGPMRSYRFSPDAIGGADR